MSDVKTKIEADVRKELGKHQREVLLREQLRAIRKERGDDSGEGDPADLRARLDKADLPPEVRTAPNASCAARHNGRAGPGAPSDPHVLDGSWICRGTRAPRPGTISKRWPPARRRHFGLADVKKRIISSTWP